MALRRWSLGDMNVTWLTTFLQDKWMMMLVSRFGSAAMRHLHSREKNMCFIFVVVVVVVVVVVGVCASTGV
jgi:uncharacterized membrane protein